MDSIDSMDVAIKVLQGKDKEMFDRLYTEAMLEDFPEYSQKVLEHLASDGYRKEMWKSPIKLGVFQGDKLIGFLLSQAPLGGVVFLHWLVIAKEQRGQGIGKLLLQEYEKMVKETGSHNIHLLVDERNISFYKKQGYEVFGFDDKSYYGSADYLMRKVIQEFNEDAAIA